MKLDGREVAGYIKERHAGEVRRVRKRTFAIVRQGATPATDMYLRVKQRYGDDIGVPVQCYTETPETLMSRIQALNDDSNVCAINVELPFADAPELTDQALAGVVSAKDVEGLAPDSTYELPTPKGIHWLLGAYNITIEGPIVVVGQGRLVGAPIASDWEQQGHEVIRCDINTSPLELEDAVRRAKLILSATGVPGLIPSDWVQSGAVAIDAGAGVVDGKVAGDFEPILYDRTDIKLTPNPGGVGPMTVAALYDNVLLAMRR